MSVLIRGMEMPQGNSTINVLIYADGTVYTGHVNDSQYSAVSVSTPHGRLIDADELMAKISTMMQEPDYQHDGENWMVGLIMARDALDEAPTVIEAEGET